MFSGILGQNKGARAPLNPQPPMAPRHFTPGELMSLVMVPFIVCVLGFLLVAESYHNSKIFVMSVMGTAALVCLANVRKNLIETPQPFRPAMAIWCLVALAWSAFFGVWAHEQYYSQYWASFDSHSYANVLPSEPAAGYIDAGKIIFARESRIDVSRSMGYKDDGVVYCVAPVVDDSEGRKIQFWAAGVDCCGARGSFSCDDAWDIKAKAGVTIEQPAMLTQYGRAVSQATAAYGMESTKTPVFVRWVVDPSRVEVNFWRMGNGMLIAVSMVFLALSGGAAMLFNNQLKKQADKELGLHRA
eukprot:TRINITY_DN94035_c0_g1_i1.p1 TRINITY_DN94035_c0_g1~~TRINITY_DN94035_c0_g1_i1.p1  ORF type:complete len:301 (+),score=65.64 TRINITY_DN94035_c0_g1_i1:123-1025(+)